MYLDIINVLNSNYTITDQFLRAQLARPYVLGSSYSIGDFCIYNNSLYQCIWPTGKSFSLTEWKSAQLANKINANYFFDITKTQQSMQNMYSRAVNTFFGDQAYISDYAFISQSNLTTIHLYYCHSIGVSAFAYCNNLLNLTLRIPFVCDLADSNAFMNTPIADSSLLGRFGSIYVLSSLVSQYSKANNWSYYSNRITGIPK